MRLLQKNVVAVKAFQNLQGGIALISQGLGPPLAQPARTAPPRPVAVLGEQGLNNVRLCNIGGKYFVHHLGNFPEDGAPIGKRLIVGGGVGDCKVKALVSIPLRIDPVEGEGDDRQNVCRDCFPGPGGINFAAGHVFDVVCKEYRDVGGVRIFRAALMHHNQLRHHRLRQNHEILSKGQFFYGILRDFGRKIPPKRGIGNQKTRKRRPQGHVLHRRDLGKHLHVFDDRLPIARERDEHVVLVKGPGLPGLHGKLQRRRWKGQLRGLSLRVGLHLLQNISGVGVNDLDGHVLCGHALVF
ncbi:hypothetical protein SDC9_95709 [bioreactor metagenome]|uniref:Uncharacterized protein n=1 Tax=bioreactor metagenome TaxID=1076179 RepID=A0A645A796_9ZZZZ